MDFLEIYNNIKYLNKGKICIVRLGAFYVAVGIDAYILNDVLRLNLSGFGKTKKVGIPVKSIFDYVSKLDYYGMPYAIYDYDVYINNEKSEELKKCENTEKNRNKEDKNKNCENSCNSLIIDNKCFERMLSSSNDFIFVDVENRSNKFKAFLDIFKMKDIVLECLKKYCSGSLGEVL